MINIVLSIVDKENLVNKPFLINVLLVSLLIITFAYFNSTVGSVSEIMLTLGIVLTFVLILIIIIKQLVRKESGIAVLDDQCVVIKTNKTTLTIPVGQVLEIVLNISRKASQTIELADWGNYLVVSHGKNILTFYLGDLSTNSVNTLLSINSFRVRKEASWRMKPASIFFKELLDSLYLFVR